MAKKWISKGYKANLILGFVGLAESTYHEAVSRMKASTERIGVNSDTPKPKGRPIPGYSYTVDGKKVSDEQIKEWLCELIAGDGFPYGHRKLTVELRETYQLIINHKKVYRLCKELDILRPRRKKRRVHPKRLAKRSTVDAPDVLWQMDAKYGYISGTDEFFFQLSLIDVCDRSIIDYHLGLSCTKEDACRVLENALWKRGLINAKVKPKIRTDNGPQFTSIKFGKLCKSLGIEHERIPVKTPNMIAHIEAFHSILEEECYSRYEFSSFLEVYRVVAEYMEYYNTRRRHGSLRYMAPNNFYQAFLDKIVDLEPFSA